MRTTAIAPIPGGVEIAAMVSSKFLISIGDLSYIETPHVALRGTNCDVSICEVFFPYHIVVKLVLGESKEKV
jgi:hypothetical protein